MPDLRSRFLPVSFDDLVDGLGASFPDDPQRERFRAVVREVRRLVADEAITLQEHLNALYDPFDRDSELIHESPPPRPRKHKPKRVKPAQREAWEKYEAFVRQHDERLAALCRCVEYLFDKANFDELPAEQVTDLLEASRRHGLRIKVRPERYEVVRVFVRGHRRRTKRQRMLAKGYRKVDYEVPSYSRLATMVKVPGQDHLQVYLYRNIDGDEFAPLLPGGKVRVGWLDRIMMLAAGGGAIGLVLRLINTVKQVADPAKTELPIWPVFAIAAAFVVGFKALMSYKRARDRHIRIITQSMFDSSLDNNAGALSYLIRLMTKEESQEGLLAYAVGLTRLEGRCTRMQLDAAVERWLRETFGERAAGANFQVGDAVETMSRYGMLADDGDHLQIRPPEQVAPALAEMRSRMATGDYHLDAIGQFQQRRTRLEAGEYWTCPNRTADGEVCCNYNSLEDAYCDLCGWPRADGELSREQEAALLAGEEAAPPAAPVQSDAAPDAAPDAEADAAADRDSI
jgi:hypothetical protein